LRLLAQLDRVRRETQRHQCAAADPAASAWVSANAGTGKTHVLTMRILRLLLGGTEPARILALTFTKAAAAEMSTRVFARLGEWVTADEADLRQGLTRLLDRPPTDGEMQRARRLFAVAIETPGGLKVQTIHAFCERLLQRFPMEAGVPPQFAILDEHERRALLADCIDEMLAEASAGEATPLAHALKTAIAYAADDNFDAMLNDALRNGAWPPATGSDGIQAWAAAEAVYRRAIGLSADADAGTLEDGLASLLSDGELAHFAEVLATGAASDKQGGHHLDEALRAGRGRGRIEALARLFLTDKGERRKALMTRALAAGHPHALAGLERAQAKFAALYEQRLKLQLIDAGSALRRLAAAVLQRYRAAKARRAALDFDDLVARTKELLDPSASVAWVLYKLDGGLDHILIDEAQDTSPEQWQVIKSLADEFFAGAGASPTVRTLFAVGDEKQSIYGFQGAAPAMFAAVGEEFEARAKRARLTWRRVPLNLSFRAVAPLLSAVDRVFASPLGARGVVRDVPLRHYPHRDGEAGLIEIWPIERKDRVLPAEPWSPLAEEIVSSPVARLANRIAATIAGWLRSGEMLESENRTVRAGDILVLVRKRAPFAAAMISALKIRGIPVAGSDRLVLSEQIAVQDLMALGDFLLLADDDLALATVLKSPLMGLDDDDLIALAPGRRGSLWQELLARAAGNARFQRAAATLRDWRERADRLPPFEFYATLLDGLGMRAAMLARLGSEAGDAIDEFLNLALAHEDTAPSSLQGFLSALREDAREITRDMEQGRDEVRVMTVHGAKGLEAPIVFLPDTCGTRSGRRPGGLITLAGADRHAPRPLLWPVKGTGGLAIVAGARASLEEAEAEERNRLLYVALTRARDRLYVAGFEGGAPPPADCWYNLISSALAPSLEQRVDGDGRRVWRAQSQQRIAPGQSAASPPPLAAAPLPAWAGSSAPEPAGLAIPLAPARLGPLAGKRQGAGIVRGVVRLADPAVLPPAALAEAHRFLRGNLTHALLEHLPMLPSERWETAAAAFVAARGAQLAASVRRDIVREALAVLRDQALHALFGPGARAEVGIVAELSRPGGRAPLRIAGRIDRLVQQGSELLIVDYKTNRPPPSEPATVAEAYLLQLSAYRLAARQIFDALHVRAALLWTDGPRIMEIPGDLLDQQERRLWQLDRASLDA
jgi:ATP-dependent helicase/nuclease subunit A